MRVRFFIPMGSGHSDVPDVCDSCLLSKQRMGFKQLSVLLPRTALGKRVDKITRSSSDHDRVPGILGKKYGHGYVDA